MAGAETLAAMANACIEVTPKAAVSYSSIMPDTEQKCIATLLSAPKQLTSQGLFIRQSHWAKPKMNSA